MSKPIVSFPHNGDTWSHSLLLVQGFHPHPQAGKLAASVKDSKGNQTNGVYVKSLGTLFVFAFKNLEDDAYILSVKETSESDVSDPLPFKIKTTATRGLVTFMWPTSGSTVQPSFAAWGTSGADLTTAGPQTMTGNNGGGTVTSGTITQQPVTGGTGYWTVQFGITDNPFQNYYQLSITNADGTGTQNNITVVSL
jgi:hypothetical protein